MCLVLPGKERKKESKKEMKFGLVFPGKERRKERKKEMKWA